MAQTDSLYYKEREFDKSVKLGFATGIDTESGPEKRNIYLYYPAFSGALPLYPTYKSIFKLALQSG